MAEKIDEQKDTPTPVAEPQALPIPQGYRQGIVTAITVLLGFSLTFFRFWGFEASGDWTVASKPSRARNPPAIAPMTGL